MNRGIAIWCEVVCDKCNRGMPGAWYKNSTTISKLRQKAKAEGWAIIDGKMTYCPDCIQNMRELNK